jgi:hypothetical protein
VTTVVLAAVVREIVVVVVVAVAVSLTISVTVNGGAYGRGGLEVFGAEDTGAGRTGRISQSAEDIVCIAT